ncbi:hypothetical protein AVEN_184782-1 [Araneus ventricosus]|uniref:Uncharacterized protein n=1 Tax=Araneus ventricosus TaxID=182803 RepID=A0A4Y1ZKP7_ARAVE|nr:hypothetical protein AVEN_184782-1 [Araneus ventricosus]
MEETDLVYVYGQVPLWMIAPISSKKETLMLKYIGTTFLIQLFVLTQVQCVISSSYKRLELSELGWWRITFVRRLLGIWAPRSNLTPSQLVGIHQPRNWSSPDDRWSSVCSETLSAEACQLGEEGSVHMDDFFQSQMYLLRNRPRGNGWTEVIGLFLRLREIRRATVS